MNMEELTRERDELAMQLEQINRLCTSWARKCKGFEGALQRIMKAPEEECTGGDLFGCIELMANFAKEALRPAIDCTPEQEGLGWKEIGVVGVDSGQILITDPSYISGDWDQNDDLSKVLHGKVILVRTDGTEEEHTRKGLFQPREGTVPFNWEEPFQFDGRLWTLNALRLAGRLRDVPVEPTRKYSYAGCCAATLQEAKAGQLDYGNGHAGAGVAAASGFGDGLYQVLARYADFGDDETGHDIRIAELRVVFIDENTPGEE